MKTVEQELKKHKVTVKELFGEDFIWINIKKSTPDIERIPKGLVLTEVMSGYFLRFKMVYILPSQRKKMLQELLEELNYAN